MISFTTWDIVRNLMLAWRWTIVLSLVTFVLGGTLGLIILFMRTSRQNWLRQIARLYIELFQGTPLLMQLFLVFFGIALFGVEVPAWLAAGLALTFWSASYLAEIWRGCVEAIPKGQWEASSVLAMNYFQQMRHIVLPQALRIAIAPTVGFGVQIIKSTAVTSIIGFIELSKAGSVITNATFRPFTVFAIVGLFYFVLCWPLSKYSQSLERKYNAAHRH
ncbi:MULTISPECIES: amino acid ABC transporter permease [unclassified Herbaspirillum]|uniref:amino acid ABC transporter permease n=1 Tax=unclassified Herbaspirillum TaxID=2624150 RepID=UPI0011544C9B|nr:MULTISPECIES: amino acid ABC transporter permease [unclassified Herbaspirillum]MBB5390270.1 polar amino acid transport system permease protein [Herbaspirillum sp. SJZ102]TQK09232.1 amino acid ABC transporter membrane protein 2 (PAAT family) [Herbaspirillum sp. SJZ130]TQK14081.1 amino acid ABC transporter membrane protein 2 (PAAT family) [Herbaspirillum sp. SJZ106]TWC69780.1 amino acid ABC transporter membrane protein 2 (PAAT family) [Herbaspirillum sp. SJZ099]